MYRYSGQIFTQSVGGRWRESLKKTQQKWDKWNQKLMIKAWINSANQENKELVRYVHKETLEAKRRR